MMPQGRCDVVTDWEIASAPAAGPGRGQPHRVLGRQTAWTGDGLRARRGAPPTATRASTLRLS